MRPRRFSPRKLTLPRRQTINYPGFNEASAIFAGEVFWASSLRAARSLGFNEAAAVFAAEVSRPAPDTGGPNSFNEAAAIFAAEVARRAVYQSGVSELASMRPRRFSP